MCEVQSMNRKEDTPMRVTRRKYEETHAKERKENNKVWATSVPRKFAENLDNFLAKYNISKAAFLYMSFDLVKKQMEENENNNAGNRI